MTSCTGALQAPTLYHILCLNGLCTCMWWNTWFLSKCPYPNRMRLFTAIVIDTITLPAYTFTSVALSLSTEPSLCHSNFESLDIYFISCITSHRQRYVPKIIKVRYWCKWVVVRFVIKMITSGASWVLAVLVSFCSCMYSRSHFMFEWIMHLHVMKYVIS